MKKGRLGSFIVLIVVLLAVVWASAVFSATNEQKQEKLIAEAEALLQEEIYLRAQPLLEEAVSYQTDRTYHAENLLKKVYLALREDQGYETKYRNLLTAQMERAGAPAEVFFEAADYYFDSEKIAKGIAALRDGVQATNDPALLEAYEANRYQYRPGRVSFQQIMEAYNGMRQVQSEEGLWGLADLSGKLSIPCLYEAVSTYSNQLAVVQSAEDGSIFSVDAANHRMYVLKTDKTVSAFGNYANDRVTMKMDDGWHRVTGTFEIGKMSFEEIGMYTAGFVAAKSGGKWGVIDLQDEWLIPAEYDGIKTDELGRCIGQDAVFAEKNGKVMLFVRGEACEGSFEDAQPFQEDGYAAVKQGGKWGFADTTGEIKIACQFDDARSFHQGLAAVKSGDKWGYISTAGEMVIEPVFYSAKSFCDGYAPVETENGWTIIRLYEYET